LCHTDESAYVGFVSSDVNKDLGLKAKDSDPKAKDLSHKAKAKDLDFGLKDQGQGLTSLFVSH